MAENVFGYEDRVLDSMMDKAFEKAGVNDYSFSEQLKDTFKEYIKIYPRVDYFFNDVESKRFRYGTAEEVADRGDDSEEFYIKYKDDLEACRKDLLNDLGEPIIDNNLSDPSLITWAVLEEVGRRVSNKIHLSLDEAISEELGKLSPDSKEMILDNIHIGDVREKTLVNMQTEWDSNEALRAVDMKFRFDKQIARYELNRLERCAFVNFQPVKVKDGWIQRGTDESARLFKTDPSNIRDEVYALAQQSAVALTKLAHDDVRWSGLADLISIKPDTPSASEKESAGVSQSLSESEKKSNGIKM